MQSYPLPLHQIILCTLQFLQMIKACIIPILQQEIKFWDNWCMKPQISHSFIHSFIQLKLCCMASVSQATKLVILLMLLSVLQSSWHSKSFVWRYSDFQTSRNWLFNASVFLVCMLYLYVWVCMLHVTWIGSHSSPSAVFTGVPQGSMLRPLFFPSSPNCLKYHHLYLGHTVAHIVDACRCNQMLGVWTTLH